MSVYKPFSSGLFALTVFAAWLHPGFSQSDPVLDIAGQELERQFAVFSEAESPAYYMDFRLEETQRYYIVADLGVLTDFDSSRFRVATARARVGSYAFDNTYTPSTKGLLAGGLVEVSSSVLPLENEPLPMQQFLWNLGTEAYEAAVEDYESVISGQVDTTDETPPSFSREEPGTYYEPPMDFAPFVRANEWKQRVMRLSKLFAAHEDVVYGGCSFSSFMQRSSFVSSEGARMAQNLPYTYVYLYAGLQGEDGSVVHLSKSYFAFLPKDLPDEVQMKADIEALVGDLHALSKAPLASPYTGPAMLAPRAAGVFFHEIFGHRIEGHRLRSELDGQTFKERINEQVLPETISVISDPTRKQTGSQDLNGYYAFDNEGIAARPVVIVENGVLKSFLMSRTPLDSIVRSNGHGRAQVGLAPVSRQSNLLIKALNSVSDEEMRAMLIEECKHQNKEYGYFFKDVTGGFTETSRYSTNAFNIQPTLVYRVYVDGRPDELVRGVDLIGTPLAMFAEIVATSEQRETFFGFCGAESGSVPVSASAPGLLVRRIETQKKPEDKEFVKPLLGPPTASEP